jgi:uncharacterized protein YfdQ (DUF2303 family)
MTTEADSVSALTKLADGAVAVSDVIKFDDGRQFLARRNDFTLEQITPKNAAKVYAPQIITQRVLLTDAGSISHYMNRFKNDSSLLFADIGKNVIHGVVDYHGRADIGGKVDPQHTAHHAILTLQYSKEWQTWTGQNERLLKHVDFAAFLEENAFDVVSPAGADLLELCRDLQVRSDVHFSSSVRMGDRVSLTFSKDEDATTKQDMSLPTEFLLSIPVYFNEPAVAVRCFMRRKIDDGELLLGFKMIRAENIRQQDFQRIVGEVEANTTLDAVYGTVCG